MPVVSAVFRKNLVMMVSIITISPRSRRRPHSQKYAKYPRFVQSVGFIRISMPDLIVMYTAGYMRQHPGIHLHASNPMEVAYAAKKSQLSTREVLIAMKKAGLGSMCGTAAEILVDTVRKKICAAKDFNGRVGAHYQGSACYGHSDYCDDHVWSL